MSAIQPTSVDLHPASFKHLAAGHPWVIKDRFTDKFRAKDRFLLSHGKKGSTYLLLNDTAHPKIKARLWSEDPDLSIPFEDSLKERLQKAFNKRKELSLKRENLFLVFGEGDQIPGLFLLKLGDGLIIFSYAPLWKKWQKEIVPFLKENVDGVAWIAWQDRREDQESPLNPLWGKMAKTMVLKEFGCQYQLDFSQGYDLGLYTDMAAIRNKFAETYSFENKSVLNLYSYTGAWSLFPLALGAKNVVSVDLSEKYMNWYLDNLKLNEFKGAHKEIVGDTFKALKSLINSDEKFDFILCDPPSFSSDGKKTTTSLKNYERLLPLFTELLALKGQALCFINTHSVTRNKYEETMSSYTRALPLKKHSSYGLSEDCPLIKNFPEGDYLKGILYHKQ